MDRPKCLGKLSFFTLFCFPSHIFCYLFITTCITWCTYNQKIKQLKKTPIFHHFNSHVHNTIKSFDPLKYYYTTTRLKRPFKILCHWKPAQTQEENGWEQKYNSKFSKRWCSSELSTNHRPWPFCSSLIRTVSLSIPNVCLMQRR